MDPHSAEAILFAFIAWAIFMVGLLAGGFLSERSFYRRLSEFGMLADFERMDRKRSEGNGRG